MLLPNHTAHSDVGPKLNKKEYYAFLITREAIRQGFNPKLAVSVATVESSLNPKAIGSKGDYGLFQLLPSHLHNDYSVRGNISEGIKELKAWQKNCPAQEGRETFVICYNSGYRHPHHPFLHPYYRRVIAAMGKV